MGATSVLYVKGCSENEASVVYHLLITNKKKNLPFFFFFFFFFINKPYPISTLPEHLHSTILRTPKLPENTQNQRKLVSFPLMLVTLLANHPLPLLTPSLGVSPSPTRSSHSKFWRPRSRLCSCAALYFVRSLCP